MPTATCPMPAQESSPGRRGGRDRTKAREPTNPSAANNALTGQHSSTTSAAVSGGLDARRTLVEFRNPSRRDPTMKIRPLHDRLLVERLEEKEVKKGGIIIPDTAKEKPQEAKVIAVGNGKVTDEGKKIPLTVKAGDKILFGKYSGSEVKIADKRSEERRVGT